MILKKIELVWEYIKNRIFKLNYLSGYKIIFVEPPLTSKKDREEISEIFFKNFDIESLYFANAAMLSLINEGKNTGIVVESKHDMTHVTPVYDFFCIPYAVKHIFYGGNYLTDYMLRLLIDNDNNKKFNFLDKKNLAKNIKELACYVAENYEKEKVESYKYILDCNNEIYLKEERIKCPEALFDPKLIGNNYESIVECCYNSIGKCDDDIKQEMYSNILLSGRNTCFKGFNKRFTLEMKKLAPSSTEINVIDVKDKRRAARKGAKILYECPFMESNWITRTEYDEIGVNIVHRKCF